MNLLMVGGDRSMLLGKKDAFWYTLQAFSKEWDRIDVICPHSKAARTMQTYFGNVYFHPSPRSLWFQSRWIYTQGKKLHGLFKYAAMTVQDYPPFYNSRGAMRLARETGMPCILEIHHIVGYPKAASFEEYIGRLWSRVRFARIIAKTRGTRVVSKTTAETLMHWGAPKSKIHVVPSFYLDRSVFERLGQAPPVQYDAVCCGRLVANKGMTQVLQAIASLKRARLLVIGDGPERARLERLAAKLEIAHRIEFRGWLPTQIDVLQAIRSARVFLQNDMSEDGQNIAIEAMAAGMPVIVTPVGVMPDVIIDGVNGLFTTGTSEDLSLKMQKVLDDEAARRNMGDQARSVLDRFERERLITMYAHFLRSFA